MAKENPTVILKSDHIDAENNIKFSVYKNEADETCYRVAGWCRGNYFAAEWHQDEDQPLENANDWYNIRLNHVNSYR